MSDFDIEVLDPEKLRVPAMIWLQSKAIELAGAQLQSDSHIPEVDVLVNETPNTAYIFGVRTPRPEESPSLQVGLMVTLIVPLNDGDGPEVFTDVWLQSCEFSDYLEFVTS